MRRDRAATTTERQALSAVCDLLEAELAPWREQARGREGISPDRVAVDAIITRVLLGFEQGRGRGEDENDTLVAEYISAVKGLPLAAIHAAAERFRGVTLLPWSRRFRPSPAEFAAEVREGLVPLRARLLHVRRVLEAEIYDVPTAAQREEVARAAEAHLQRMRQVEPRQHRPETPAEIARAREAKLHEDLARLREAGRGPDIGRLIARIEARHSLTGGASGGGLSAMNELAGRTGRSGRD
ncbi:hypothetical protein ACRAWG_31460 [Methylobacterium sp. P31]